VEGGWFGFIIPPLSTVLVRPTLHSLSNFSNVNSPMQLIFAAVGNQNNNADDMDDVSTIIILAVYGGFFLAYYLIKIFFLLTLSRTLSQCHPRNQAMQPGMVWLNLIPLFEFVWQFVTVSRISQSLKDEFRDRGRRIRSLLRARHARCNRLRHCVLGKNRRLQETTGKLLQGGRME
jgi:hypothetical protein